MNRRRGSHNPDPSVVKGSPDRVFPGHHLGCGSIQIPLWIRGVPNLGAGARLVYGTLVWAAGGHKAVSGRSVDFLAAAAGISRRSFERHLRELEMHRLIQRADPVGREPHQRYHFLRHQAMFVTDEYLASLPEFVNWEARGPYGVKATARYMEDGINWLVDTRHETGWDKPGAVG